MKIKSFNFNSDNQNWHIEEVYFDDLNLLVGASGVGKTRILRALDLICDVAKGKDRKLDDVEWSINFSHLGHDYKWDLKTSNSIDEAFSSEPGQAEILYEKLIEVKDDHELEILQRTTTEFKLNSEKLPKLKRTESAITLLAEEDSIAPIAEAFKRFIFNETPQQAIFSTPFNPANVSMSSQKINEMPAQGVSRDRAVFRKMRAHIGQRHRFSRPRQTKGHIACQGFAGLIAHLRKSAFCCLDDAIRKLGSRTGAFQNMDVKGGEVDKIEPHAGGAIGQSPRQIGAGPVQHRHKVITNHLNPRLGDVGQAGFPVGNMVAPSALLFPDVLRHRQAFHHVPPQC